jgi:hypothetical protein
MSPLGKSTNILSSIPAPGDDENDDNDDEYEVADGVEIRRKTEVLAGNPPQFLFVHHKSHSTRPGIEPRPSVWEASDYGQWYGTEFGAQIKAERRCWS